MDRVDVVFIAGTSETGADLSIPITATLWLDTLATLGIPDVEDTVDTLGIAPDVTDVVFVAGAYETGVDVPIIKTEIVWSDAVDMSGIVYRVDRVDVVFVTGV